MSLITIILLAISLAMDCFTVSIAQGIGYTRTAKHGSRMYSGMSIVMALLFGLFQGGMPLLAYYGASFFETFFVRWSHWIALVLLSVIGGKMVYEACVSKQAEKPVQEEASIGLWEVLVLAVATSIDAFSVGVLFVPVPDSLWCGVAIIALMSTLLSLVGFAMGRMVGRTLRIDPTLLGGIVLIALGVKIFVQHLGSTALLL